MKNYKPKPCKVCDEVFKPRSKTNKYCSRTCKAKADTEKRSKKPKTKTCKTCNTMFAPYTSLDKFCSATCRIENMKLKRVRRWDDESVEKRKGENNPAFRHGNYIRKKDGNIKNRLNHKERLFIKTRLAMRADMLNEHGYTFCQKCMQQTGSLNAHHIVFRSEAPKHENLHDKQNLILVCVKCHNFYHNKKDRRNHLIEERKLWELFDHLPQPE